MNQHLLSLEAITQKEVTTLSQPCDTGAGFFAENDESELSVENRPIVSIPAPLFSSDRPICLEYIYRFYKGTIETLVKLLRTKLDPATGRNHALTAAEKVLVAVRFFAFGNRQINREPLFKESPSH
ncbi:hypothetical protein TNCV_3927451 [Trichonephila clavipes]|nr:hypothetical protein TNCV_3927451 [Trichonephila clavipes]